MLRFGGDMRQCSQLRIGLALWPFCLLFLPAFLPHSHTYRYWSSVRRSWRSEWQKGVIDSYFATLTHISAPIRRETSLSEAKCVTFCVQLFRAGLWVNLDFGRIYASVNERT